MTTRTPRTPAERAISELLNARRSVDRHTKKFERLNEELNDTSKGLTFAKARLDYAFKNPALPSDYLTEAEQAANDELGPDDGQTLDQELPLDEAVADVNTHVGEDETRDQAIAEVKAATTEEPVDDEPAVRHVHGQNDGIPTSGGPSSGFSFGQIGIRT